MICQNKLFCVNGFTLLNYTDVGLAGVDFDFVAVVVIEVPRGVGAAGAVGAGADTGTDTGGIWVSGLSGVSSFTDAASA